MVDGYLKLMYPNGEFTKEELEEVIQITLEMHRQIADDWFSQCNRTKGNQCRKCQFLGHADTLQILIIDNVILGRCADRAADPVAICFQRAGT